MGNNGMFKTGYIFLIQREQTQLKVVGDNGTDKNGFQLEYIKFVTTFSY